MNSSADFLTDSIDRERLEQLYGDDLEMLHSTIEMFLEEVTPIFLDLRNHIELQNWADVTSLTHQLRPWLGMVGLTSLEHKLWQVEKLAKKNPDHQILIITYNNFNADLDQMMPVLQLELQRMN